MRKKGAEIVKLKLKTYQCGTARGKGEGLRIGTVRFLPRGVKKEDYIKYDYFDVWLPPVAPSRKLLAKFKKLDFDDKAIRDKFFELYEKELETDTVARQSVLLLAEIAKRTPIAVGCYCADEQRCHRSMLNKIIHKAAEGKWLK